MLYIKLDMATPERIIIRYNAASACDDFFEAGIKLDGIYKEYSQDSLPEDLMRVMGSKIGRLFAINGREPESNDRITLKPKEIVDAGIVFSQTHTEPTFEDIYTVALEPPPYIDRDGDIIYDLIKPIK